MVNFLISHIKGKEYRYLRSTFFLGSSWFNNYKPGILKRPIDLQELSEPTRENIYNYKAKAVGRKVQWLEEAKEEDIMNVPPEKVNQWVKDLDGLRKDVNKSVSDLEHEISCQKISYREIFQNTINKIRERKLASQ